MKYLLGLSKYSLVLCTSVIIKMIKDTFFYIIRLFLLLACITYGYKLKEWRDNGYNIVYITINSLSKRFLSNTIIYTINFLSSDLFLTSSKELSYL